MTDKTIRNIAAVVLGIAIVVFGCMTQLVGHATLHGFLVFVGAIMIISGGWSLA